MGIWNTIRGWFGGALDDATGGAFSTVEDAVDTVEEAQDFAADPTGGVRDMAEDLADDATGGAVTDTRYAQSVVSDPMGGFEDAADQATGGAFGDVQDAADLAGDVRNLADED